MLQMIFLNSAPTSEIKLKAESVGQYLSEEVLQKMKLCYFQTGESLYTEGEKSKHLLVLLQGSCKVFKTAENGKAILLCRYEDIQILGEFELFGDPVAKTNIQALTDVYCFEISLEEHKELLLSDNLFLRFVCRQISGKITRNNINTAINLLYPLEQRLAGYILSMQEKNLFFTNYTMLAEYLGCSQRHLLRTLHLLCDKQMLEKEKSVYRLKDISALQALAGDVYLK